VAALVLVAFTAAGCSTSFFVGDWSIDDVQPTLPGESVETVVEVDVAALERITPPVLWRQRYEGLLGARIGPSGEQTVVFGTLPGGLGLELLDDGGSKRWDAHFNGSGLRSIRADVHAQPPVVTAVAGDGSANSHVSVFNLQGQELWRRRATASATLVVSADATRFALLEPVAGRLRLLDRRGQELGEFAISPDAAAAFYHDQNVLLINDADRVRLVSQAGDLLFTQDIDREFERSVVLSPGGDRVAMTTAGSDSTAYVFDLQGRLLWSKPLFLGGTNEPAFSPDGSFLYVYNVGDGAGIYGLDTATGAVSLRLFPAVPEGRRATVRNMWTTDTAVVIDFVTSPRVSATEGSADEEHVLLVAAPDASSMRRLPLGRNVEVDLSDDGRRLLVVQRQAAAGSAAATTLVVYDLESVLAPAR